MPTKVAAPRSWSTTRLPLSSLVTAFSRYGVISASSPRLIMPSSGTPATSVAKRTQRVHWMQRVITVLMSGPMNFSSTARLFSR